MPDAVDAAATTSTKTGNVMSGSKYAYVLFLVLAIVIYAALWGCAVQDVVSFRSARAEDKADALRTFGDSVGARVVGVDAQAFWAFREAKGALDLQLRVGLALCFFIVAAVIVHVGLALLDDDSKLGDGLADAYVLRMLAQTAAVFALTAAYYIGFFHGMLQRKLLPEMQRKRVALADLSRFVANKLLYRSSDSSAAKLYNELLTPTGDAAAALNFARARARRSVDDAARMVATINLYYYFYSRAHRDFEASPARALFSTAASDGGGGDVKPADCFYLRGPVEVEDLLASRAYAALFQDTPEVVTAVASLMASLNAKTRAAFGDMQDTMRKFDFFLIVRAVFLTVTLGAIGLMVVVVNSPEMRNALFAKVKGMLSNNNSSNNNEDSSTFSKVQKLVDNAGNAKKIADAAT